MQKQKSMSNDYCNDIDGYLTTVKTYIECTPFRGGLRSVRRCSAEQGPPHKQKNYFINILITPNSKNEQNIAKNKLAKYKTVKYTL